MDPENAENVHSHYHCAMFLSCRKLKQNSEHICTSKCVTWTHCSILNNHKHNFQYIISVVTNIHFPANLSVWIMQAWWPCHSELNITYVLYKSMWQLKTFFKVACTFLYWKTGSYAQKRHANILQNTYIKYNVSHKNYWTTEYLVLTETMENFTVFWSKH